MSMLLFSQRFDNNYPNALQLDMSTK